MNQIKALLIIGFVFAANGVTFLSIGLSSQSTAYSTLGPSFLVLGIVLMGVAAFRKRSSKKAESQPPHD